MRKLAASAVGVLAAISLGVMNAPVAGAAVGSGSGATAVAGTAAPTGASSAGADELTGDIAFSAPSGTFQNALSVSLATSVANAQIRYTTDGQPPTAASTVYSGAALRFTATTQLRAQAFVGGTAAGAPGTAMYIARSVDATHDIPVLVMDAYGKGKPGKDAYADAATMLLEPTGGSTSLAAAPTLVTRAGFHLRGQSSSTFEKAPYRLELWDNANDDADHPILGMPADSDWVLRGPYTDKTLIRDAFVYDLAREMGLQAPRYRFVEYYLNLDGSPLSTADYQGVYMIVETIKVSEDRLNLTKLRETDTTEPAISGGYVFKFDWMAAEEPIIPCTGPAATCWNYLEVVEPDPLIAEQKTWLTQYVQQFNTMLHSTGYADPTSGYASYIDVNSWVDRLIIGELSREMDSYIRSAYFHKDRGGKLVAGPMWDFDLSFGVGGYFNNTQTAGWQYQQIRQPVANDWYNVLVKDPAFVNKVKARWAALRQGILSNAQLSARMDALAAPLTNAAARNFQKWDILSDAQVSFFLTPTAPTWQGQLDAMRTWMTQRAAWLDSASGWGSAASTRG